MSAENTFLAKVEHSVGVMRHHGAKEAGVDYHCSVDGSYYGY